MFPPNLCPKCYHDSASVVYSCTTPGCNRAHAPQTASDAIADEQTGKHLCAQCKKPLSARLCPDCGAPLLAAEGELPFFPLYFAGGSDVGKSTYFAVLIDRIRQVMSKTYGCALHPLDGDSTMQLYDQNYRYPLYEQGRCPASTDLDAPEPLGYSLVFSGERALGKTCSMTFSDSCGASFGSEKDCVRYNPGLPHAGGILLFISPAQLPGARESLELEPPLPDQGAERILTRIIQAIRDASGLTDLQKKIDIPIAVCLTKMDLAMDQLDPASFVAHQSRHLREAYVDKIDLRSCSLEIQSLMESWGGRELVHQVKAQFSRYCFFGLTSLGAQPSGSGNRIHRVVSHRVLDPFLWLLWRNQIIRCD